MTGKISSLPSPAPDPLDDLQGAEIWIAVPYRSPRPSGWIEDAVARAEAMIGSLKGLSGVVAAFGLAQTRFGGVFLAERKAEEREAVERRRAQDCGFCFYHGHEVPCPLCAVESEGS